MPVSLPEPSADTPLKVEFYSTPNDGAVVSEEIKSLLDKQSRTRLGAVIWRLQTGQLLPRDLGRVSGARGIQELKLTDEGNEYRLYIARVRPRGSLLVLALKFHRKGGRGAQDQAISVAQRRLADWRRRL